MTSNGAKTIADPARVKNNISASKKALAWPCKYCKTGPSKTKFSFSSTSAAKDRTSLLTS